MLEKREKPIVQPYTADVLANANNPAASPAILGWHAVSNG
jgi:hypothetical protein